jgi:DNA-directed RNA polymerase specialized sigma24 family protein
LWQAKKWTKYKELPTRKGVRGYWDWIYNKWHKLSDSDFIEPYRANPDPWIKDLSDLAVDPRFLIEDLVPLLTPKQYQVIFFRYVKSLNFTQISKAMDLSPSTIKEHHKAALIKIKRYINNEEILG